MWALGALVSIDQNYQNAVDLEIDSLARLSSCELMNLTNHEKIISIGKDRIKINFLIQDFGDIRHIGVIASQKLLVGTRNFAAGITIELNSKRMSKKEVAELYD